MKKQYGVQKQASVSFYQKRNMRLIAFDVQNFIRRKLTIFINRISLSQNATKRIIHGCVAFMLATGLGACESTKEIGDIVKLGSLSEALGFSKTNGDNDQTTNAKRTSARSDSNDALEANAPPMLSIGDRFIFDNPEITWQVVGRSGNAIYWQADNGDTQITDANPVLPALEWRSERRGSGKRVISGLTGNMFPLEVGKTISFYSSVSTDQPPYNWDFNWICNTTQIHKVTTPLLGAVDTFEIVCGRQGQDELIFDYSPEIGHYVRMEAKGNDGFGRTVRNLIAYSRSGSTMNLKNGSQAATLNIASNQNNGGANNVNGAMSPASLMSVNNITSANGGVSPNGNLPANTNNNNFNNGGNILANAPNVSNRNSFNNNLSSDNQTTRPGFDLGLIPENEQQQRQSLFETPPARIGSGTNNQNSQNNTNNQIASTNQNTQNQATQPTNSGFSSGGASSGGALIHLASYRKTSTAERGWRELSERYGDVLAGLNPVIREADIAGKGIFQRLMAGPIGSESDARELCRRLQSRGAFCAVMR